ncbi:MAG: MFS transporter [Thermodesulfobacteriota bacterium]|nr:MAG: MFS transporter [Thermodesulfobacteriota bacterium]
MKLNKTEIKAIAAVGLIMAIRLLGIFLILPVFSVYAEKYPGADLALAGVAFGVYALVQSILQIPFGWLSDRIGRKPVLIIGLTIFAIGSLICGLADNINELIIARIIQGAGAVSSVAVASLGDATRPGVRAQSFTIVGITIGAGFLIAIILGPLLAAEIGFSGLFYILTALGVLAILITLFFFPRIEKKELIHEESAILSYLKNPEIKKLLASAAVISSTVNMFVFIYPLSWTEIGVSEADLWKVYLIALIPTALFAYPYVRYSEKRGKLKLAITSAWALIAISFLVYPASSILPLVLYLAGMAYFMGHTVLQSVFPAFLTQRVGQEKRGITTGVYNLSSFLGASIGGMSAGYLYQVSPHLPLLIALLLVITWGLIGLPNTPEKSSSK